MKRIVQQASVLLVFAVSCTSVGPSLKIISTSERLDISINGKQPITIVTDGEQGVYAPIVDKQLRLSGSQYLILGWSTGGGGMQTIYALLMDTKSGDLRLSDTLEIETDRHSSGLVIDLQAHPPRIGIPRPEPRYGGRFHYPEDWELSVTGATMPLQAIKKLAYERVPIDGKKC